MPAAALASTSSSTTISSKLWMDAYQAPLNPCSLECLTDPVALADGTRVWPMMMACYELLPAASELHPQSHPDDEDDENDENGEDYDSREGDPRDHQQQQQSSRPEEQRIGHMDLFLVRVPDISKSNQAKLPLKFGQPFAALSRPGPQLLSTAKTPRFQTASTLQRQPLSCPGILDGKWMRIPKAFQSSSVEKVDDRDRNEQMYAAEAASSLKQQHQQQEYWYATAHSNGTIQIHALSILPPQAAHLDSDPLFTWHPTIGQSEPLEWNAGGTARDASATASSSIRSRSPLCLSLAWDTTTTWDRDENDDVSPLRLISTYSDGRVALHHLTVTRTNISSISTTASTAPSTLAPLSVQLMTRDVWQAHTMMMGQNTKMGRYTTVAHPAEVWCACFMSRPSDITITDSSGDCMNPATVLLTGGDDGTVKLWDLRSILRPMQVIHDASTAGITALAPHPRHDHLVAIGSYDETVSLWDLRYTATPLMSSQTTSSTTALCSLHPWSLPSSRLGGGIWRLKWHPRADHRLLVAAMHGGCRILQWPGLLQQQQQQQQQQKHQLRHSSSLQPNHTSIFRPRSVSSHDDNDNEGSCHHTRPYVTQKFCEHDSMVYGADWLVCDHPTHPNAFVEAAASCSFYDRAAFLWDSVFGG